MVQHRQVRPLPVWGLLDLVYADTINDMVYLSGSTCVGRNSSFSHNAVVSSYLSVWRNNNGEYGPSSQVNHHINRVGSASFITSATNNHEYKQHHPDRFHVQPSTVQRGQRGVVNVRGVFRQEVGLVQHYLLQRAMNAARCFGQGAGQQHPRKQRRTGCHAVRQLLLQHRRGFLPMFGGVLLVL